MKDKKQQKRKKPYMKPEVRQVPLRPEEAVLGACKVTTSDSGIGNLCGIACPTLGS